MEVMMGQREAAYQRSMVDSFMESIALESILMATKSAYFLLSLSSFLNESGVLEMFNRDASRLDEPIVIRSEGKILRLVSSGTAPDANGQDITEAPVDDGDTDDEDDGDEQDDDAEEEDDDEDGADDKNNPEEEDDDDEVEVNGQGDDDEDDEDDEDDDDDDDDGGEEDDEEDEEEDEEEAPEPPAKKRK